ncbi:RNA-directed DNA polymerase, eukaryota, reverse transcriptase zinc-binding domain protein [Tanacetum coccineum]
MGLFWGCIGVGLVAEVGVQVVVGFGAKMGAAVGAFRCCNVDEADVYDWYGEIYIMQITTEDVSSLTNLLNGRVLDPSHDNKWVWPLESSGKFTVKSISLAIQKKLLVSDISEVDQLFSWNSWVPRKINICAWRVFLDRIPTRANLVRRGIHVENPCCVFCEEHMESTNHCFFSCRIIKPIWIKIWSWWNASGSFNPFLDDILKGSPDFSEDKRVSKNFHAACLCAIWHVWAWRNKIFYASTIEEAISARHEDIFYVVQWLSLLWISNRAPFSSHSWDLWVHHPNVLGLS